MEYNSFISNGAHTSGTGFTSHYNYNTFSIAGKKKFKRPHKGRKIDIKKPIHRSTLSVFDMLALIGYEFSFIRLGQIHGEMKKKKTIFVAFSTNLYGAK